MRIELFELLSVRERQILKGIRILDRLPRPAGKMKRWFSAVNPPEDLQPAVPDRIVRQIQSPQRAQLFPLVSFSLVQLEESYLVERLQELLPNLHLLIRPYNQFVPTQI